MIDQETREKDLAMLRDSDSWNNWPVLPVVNRDREHTWPDAGVVYADGSARVHLVNMWNMKAEWPDHKSEKFVDFEAMLDAGWEVD